MRVEKYSGTMSGKALCFRLINVGSVLRESGEEVTQLDCVWRAGLGAGRRQESGAEAVTIAGR